MKIDKTPCETIQFLNVLLLTYINLKSNAIIVVTGDRTSINE